MCSKLNRKNSPLEDAVLSSTGHKLDDLQIHDQIANMHRPEDAISKGQLRGLLLRKFDSEDLLKLIAGMCSDSEMVDFILSFSGDRITGVMHEQDSLSETLAISD